MSSFTRPTWRVAESCLRARVSSRRASSTTTPKASGSTPRSTRPIPKTATTAAAAPTSTPPLKTLPPTQLDFKINLPIAKKVRAHPEAKNWPWRTTGQVGKNGLIREERTVFARPSHLRPKMLWVVVAVWLPACIFMSDTLLRSGSVPEEPKPEPSPTSPASTQKKERTIADAISSSLDPIASTRYTKDSFLAGIILSTGLAFTFIAIYWPTRLVTKIKQVRYRVPPRPNNVETAKRRGYTWTDRVAIIHDQGVLIETAATEMWAGKWGKPRYVEMENIDVNRVLGGKIEWDSLKMVIKPTTRLERPLDKFAYRVNFGVIREGDYPRDPKTGKSPEIVVSLPRMEEVFGEM